MSGGDPSGVFRDIRTVFSDGMLGGLTDKQLLERFANRKDGLAEDAFSVILARHGPMVWGVCRRLLGDRCDADDAFQATFLVLVRRAAAVRVDDSLGPWLYGVSRRIAARAASVRRRARGTGSVEAVAGPSPDPEHTERLSILEEEIGRLPERQRAAVVLCDLEGLPHAEAASRLGCPIGTVESRLSRGRLLLRERLTRRGFAPAAAALWAEMAHEASASMPLALVKRTAHFVTSSPAAGAVPVAVAALAEGVIQMMWLARLKPVAAVLLVLGVGTAAELRSRAQGEPAKAAPTPNQTIARKQLALIDQALDTAHQLAMIGRLDLSDPTLSLWGRRKLETLRKTGAGKAEIIESLEKYRQTLEEEEAIAKARRESARGTMMNVYDVQFRRMEAEMLLNDEKSQ